VREVNASPLDASSLDRFSALKIANSIEHWNKMVLLKKRARVCLLALVAIGLAGAMFSLRAQEQTAAPSKNQPSHDSSKHQGFGRQLTHETREAAGEGKDENAEFKESPSVQFIARHTGLSDGHAYLLSILLNFAVIVGLILWAARKYLPGVFHARTEAIQKAMQEAQKASEDARRRLAEIESRLMRLDGEIGMMRNSAEKEAAVEEARIQAAAEEDARRIVESAQQEIASAAKTARRELTAYAADLAIGLAKQQIHVDSGTDQKLVRNFTGELGAYADASGSDRRGPNASGKDGH
jgi:F-type H+-transporting ATPase subunit b